MSNTEPTKPFGVFHDAETNETIVRDLTPEEIASLPPDPEITFKELS